MLDVLVERMVTFFSTESRLFKKFLSKGLCMKFEDFRKLGLTKSEKTNRYAMTSGLDKHSLKLHNLHCCLQ